ncbi:RNA-binding protein 25 isoform X2 [Carica papaya]|uniref:RNA-binding protein 25 isoform X2 n=1 Tax=Carica papaya TaxID=3649 RepID=UPI000B8C99EF|nr:RNA-binding protein 25 isoform X2 [Carica papaya]
MGKDTNGSLPEKGKHVEEEKKSKGKGGDNSGSESEEDRKNSKTKRKSRGNSDSDSSSESESEAGGERRVSSRRKKERRKSDRKSRKRFSSDDEDSDSTSASESEYSSEYSDSEESESEEERRRRKRKQRRRRERDEERERERERKRRRREKEKKSRRREREQERDRKKKRKEEKKKKKKEKLERGKRGAVTNSWGKYGIIRETDMWNKRPEFTAWLAEVKQVNLESLPNWEEKQMFKEYYNLDAYYKHKMEKEQKKGIKKVLETERTVFNDEEQRRLELQQAREKHKEEQVEALKQSMQGGMAQAMREQAQLREEMAYQYKLGNFEAAAAIQRRLDPDVAM